MATTTHPTATRNGLADYIGNQLDSGLVVLKTAADATVATLTLNAAAFPAASNGVITAEAISPDTNATGNASAITKAELQTSGATAVVLCDVSTVTAGTGAIQLSSVIINAGDQVSMSSLTYEAAP